MVVLETVYRERKIVVCIKIMVLKCILLYESCSTFHTVAAFMIALEMDFIEVKVVYYSLWEDVGVMLRYLIIQ